MALQTQTKRYKELSDDSTGKIRQLSGLFSIISSNLLLATEVLSTEYKIKTASELEMLSHKARVLAKELSASTCTLNQESIEEKISFLKNKLLFLIESLNNEICSLDARVSTNKKSIEDLILAKRLLRESQRGLVTIQD